MATPSILIVPDRYKSGVLYSQLPESGAVDFDVTRATTAYRTNASGVLESVASGVPRLDYQGGGCPALLVEPAATNLALRSEEFDDASWVKVAGTVTQNNSLAPDGTMSADTFTADGTNASHRFFQAVTAVSGTTYQVSYYVKRGTADYVQIAFSGATPFGLTNFANFDLLNGTVGTTGGLQTNSQISFNAVTGYYRISSQITAIGTGIGQIDLVIVSSASAPRLQSWATSQSIICWGAQLEAGSVATSYIPTTSASVTRNADAISKTGVSGFIGQTEGTIYVDFTYRGAPINRSGPIYLRQANLRGLALNYASSVAGIEVISRNDAGTAFISVVSGTLQIGTNYKIAIAYDAAGTAAGGTRVNGITVYVNGILAATGNFQVPDAASLNEIRMYGANSGTDTEAFNGQIRAAALYTTRLPNAELAALTTL